MWIILVMILQVVGVPPTGRELEKWCREIEAIEPNLRLREATHLRGRITLRQHQYPPLPDAFVPLEKSQVELRTYISQSKQISVKVTTTGEDGTFDLGVVEAGKYRLLASPNRNMGQPGLLECANKECNLEISLQMNPTDMPVAACPIR
jgi:hypothetical protein